MTPDSLTPLIAPPNVFDYGIELKLSEQGLICGCDIPTCELFGYPRDESTGEHISELMPELAAIKLMRGAQINPRFTFSSDRPSAPAALP